MDATPSEGRLRVAVFSDSYAPIVNGVSVSIQLLVEELRRLGHSVHVFCTAFKGHKDADPNVCRFPSVVLPFAPEYPLARPPFYPMLRHFRKRAFDLVHTHTPYTVGFVGLRWAESHGLPIVSTYHTLYERYAHYVPFFPRWYVRYRIARHTNYYYNRCDHVTAPSEAARNSLARHSVTAPCTIVPTGNPEPTRASKEEVRKELGLRDSDRVLLYTGRIAKEKNLPVLLEAASLVMADNPNANLWLVGDGPFRKECQELVRRFGIGDRVRFVGQVARQEVDRYYMAADVFVFSSVTETQGLVIGEAMSFGVPAVAVRGGGASDAIVDDENGYVVGNSAAQMADRLLRILSNHALHGRLSGGARRSVRRWTSRDACAAMLEVYRSALARRAASGDAKGEGTLAREHSRAD